MILPEFRILFHRSRTTSQVARISVSVIRGATVLGFPRITATPNPRYTNPAYRLFPMTISPRGPRTLPSPLPAPGMAADSMRPARREKGKD